MLFRPLSHRARSIGSSESAEPRPEQPASRRLTLRLLEHASAVLAVLFIGVYGVVRTSSAEFYNALGLAPEDVGLTQVRLVVSAGFLFAFLLAMTLMAYSTGHLAWRLSQDFAGSQRSWRRALLLVAILSLILAQPVAFTSGLTRSWLWLASSSAVLGGLVAVSSILLDGSFGSWISSIERRLFPGGRSYLTGTAVLVVAFLVLAPIMLLSLVEGEGRAGRRLRFDGKLPTSLLTPTYPVFPARVVPRGDDPLGICDGSRVAILVGRDGGRSYVLLRAPGSGGPAPALPGEVLPLSEGDYSVVTGVERPVPCTRRAAAPVTP